jgi:hypothetical protein
MSKPPAFWFFTGDWMKDPALRACSPAARGVWMDMLCMMHESPHRGFLETSQGHPYSDEQIARMTGCDMALLSQIVTELFTTGVASKTDSGTIFNRRMKRDEMTRALARERQRRHRNQYETKADGNGSVTPQDERDTAVTDSVTKFEPVTPVTPLSQRSSNTSNTANTSVTKQQRFSSRISRAVEGNGTVDSEEPAAQNPSHALPDQPAEQAAEDREAFALAEAEPALPNGEANPHQAYSAHQSKQHAGIVASLFAHYCETCHRDPARYTLTPQRLKKALLRLHERIKLTGSLALAIDDLRHAIDNLAASEYHRTHGYLDWEAQIFRSREEFEKRLTAIPTPTEVNHGQPRFESVEEYNARNARETIQRMAHKPPDPTR